MKASSLDKYEAEQLMKSICRRYDIRLILDSSEDSDEVNGGCCAGLSEIRMYPFVCENKVERRLIAFFHELAHCVSVYDSRWSKMQNEMEFSQQGIYIALYTFGVEFSDDAVKWLIEQNFTYKDWEEREVRGEQVNQ